MDAPIINLELNRKQQTSFSPQPDDTLTNWDKALSMVYVRFVGPITKALCDKFLFWGVLFAYATAEANLMHYRRIR